MANLLSWLGGAAKKVGNVAAGVERQLNPLDNGATYSNPAPAAAPHPSAYTQVRQLVAPTVRGVGGFVSGAKDVAAILPNDFRAITGIATHNDAAANNAMLNAGHGLQALESIIRGIAQAPVRVGTSAVDAVTPGMPKSFTPTNSVEKLILGDAPIGSYNKLATAAGGGTKGQGEVIATALGDLATLGGAKEGAAKVIDNIPKVVDAYHANPVLADQRGSVPIPGTPEEPSLPNLPQRSGPQPPTPVKPDTLVNSDPMKIQVGKNDKATAQNLRDAYTGYKNSQIVKGNQLADTVKALAPKEQNAIFWHNEAGGDVSVLKNWLDYKPLKEDLVGKKVLAKDQSNFGTVKNITGDQAEVHFHNKGSGATADVKLPLSQLKRPNGSPLLDNPLAEHATDIKAAMNLSPAAQQAAGLLKQYYGEAGANALDKGAIGSIRADYNNARIYKPEQQGDFVQTGLNKDLKMTTSHAKQRVYDNMFEAINHGKIPATTNASDLMSIHNEELAKTVASRQLADQMVESGLGAKVKLGDKPPAGYKSVVTTGGSVLTAPEHIANGLRALTDPNFLNNYQTIKNIRKFQGVVKTVDLSYSMFHHLTMLTQTLGQTASHPLDTIRIAGDLMGGKDVAPLEQDFAAHGGITSKLGDNQDVLHTLAQAAPSRLDKVAELPGVKQLVEANNKNAEFLFGKVQRYLKVMDYSQKAANWVAKHPEATNDEVIMAKRGMAKEVNNAYGGLNWESMGVDKTTQGVMRLAFLAPDWLVSNFSLGKQAFAKDAGGMAARRNLATTLIGGMLTTEAANKAITGHYTNDNEKGHQFEVQVQPGVYVSLMRGGIGDLIKLASNMADNGPTTGAGRYLEGKLSPIARTGVGLITGRNYYGQAITKKGDPITKDIVNEGKFIASSAGPIPFSATSLPAYLKSGQPVNPVSTGLVGTGLARYSAVPKTSANSPTQAGANTDLAGQVKADAAAKAADKKVPQGDSIDSYLSKDQLNFLKLDKQEQQAYLAAHPNQAYLAKSADAKAAAEQTVNGIKVNLPANLDKQSAQVLTNYGRLSSTGKDKFNSDPANSYSLKLAQYHQKIAAGDIKAGSPEDFTAKQTLAKSGVTTKYSPEVNDLYSMSVANRQAAIAANPALKSLMPDVMKLSSDLANHKFTATDKIAKASAGRKIPKAGKLYTGISTSAMDKLLGHKTKAIRAPKVKIAKAKKVRTKVKTHVA